MNAVLWTAQVQRSANLIAPAQESLHTILFLILVGDRIALSDINVILSGLQAITRLPANSDNCTMLFFFKNNDSSLIPL